MDRFKRQMRFLKRERWNTFLVSDLKNIHALPPCSVALTFDDGFMDNYELALPVLLELGQCATWFIASQDIGKPASWDHPSPYDSRLMAPGQIRRMAASGMEIGGHSRSHSDLTTLQEDALKEEILGSKRDLEDITGSKVTSFAYPFGRWNERVLKITAEAGYGLACTTSPGRVSRTNNLLAVPRVAVFSEDTTSSFARKLIYASTRVDWGQMIGNKAADLAGRVKGIFK